MKKKVVIMSFLMTFVFLISQVSAGSSSRRRLEGFLIGSGVTLLSVAAIKMMNGDDRPRNRKYYRKAPARHPRQRRVVPGPARSFHVPPPPEYRAGVVPAYAGPHVTQPVSDYIPEKRKTWVEPVYAETWVSGYYNKRQQWVEGYSRKVLVQEGYWAEVY